jgi:hypothetical protein
MVTVAGLARANGLKPKTYFVGLRGVPRNVARRCVRGSAIWLTRKT